MAITRTTGIDNSSVTWDTIAPAAGDLVIVLFANDGGDNQTTPSTPYPLIRFDPGNIGTTVEFGAYYRICAGGETGTLIASEGTFGVSSEEYAWHVLKIPAAEWHGTTPPECARSRATSGTADPPSLNPAGWGIEETTWIVAVARDDDDGFSSLGANYVTNFVRTAGGLSGPEVVSSWRINEAESEDPPASTHTGTTEEYIAFTIGVRPAAAPSGPVITDADDEDFINGEEAVTITGTDFQASQGDGIVELGDNATYGSANLQEQTVESWGDTSIDITIDLGALTAGTLYLFVTDNDSEVSSGYEVTVAKSFDDIRQDIIDGLDSAQSEGTGWDAEVKGKIPVTDVVRTSNTVVTITLTAAPDYDITAQETIEVTIPASALAGAEEIVATPTFTVDVAAGGETYIKGFLDALDLKDSSKRSFSFKRSLYGQESINDSNKRIKGLKKFIYDAIDIIASVKDQLVAGGEAFIRIFLESIDLVDLSKRQVTFKRIASSTVDLIASIKRSFVFKRFSQDTIDLISTIKRAITFKRPVYAKENIFDSNKKVSFFKKITLSIINITASLKSKVSGSLKKIILESIGISDSLKSKISTILKKILLDSVGIVENSIKKISFLKLLYNLLGITDSEKRKITLKRIVLSPVSLISLIFRKISYQRKVFAKIDLIEKLVGKRTLIRLIYDTLSILDRIGKILTPLAAPIPYKIYQFLYQTIFHCFKVDRTIRQFEKDDAITKIKKQGTINQFKKADDISKMKMG